MTSVLPQALRTGSPHDFLQSSRARAPARPKVFINILRRTAAFRRRFAIRRFASSRRNRPYRAASRAPRSHPAGISLTFENPLFQGLTE